MLKIVVAIKFYKGEIGPFDESALECALSVENAEVILLAMAPLSVKERLEYYTRLGAARAILLTDETFAGSDTLATARTLAQAVKMLNADIVVCGRQSINGDTAQVPPQLAVFAGYSFFPYIMKFGVKEVQTRTGKKEVCLPAVLSIERIASLRMPRIGSEIHTAEIWDRTVLGLQKDECGQIGSKTKVLRVFEKKESKRKCFFIESTQLKTVILNASRKAENIYCQTSEIGERLDTVYFYGEGAKTIAERIAKKAIRLNETEPSKITEEITTVGASAVLFEADSYYRVVAPQVAAYLGEGLAADCTKISVKDGRLLFYRPAVADSSVAEVLCTGKIQLATVRNKRKSSDIVFGIGWGALEYTKKIAAYAKQCGATLVCSRRIADAGILPYEMQVGLTGKVIVPKVYVAFGISGAIQHFVGVENAETIIAVNRDKKAKIFDYADFGITEDIKDVEL